jgi:hypothetical protein
MKTSKKNKFAMQRVFFFDPMWRQPVVRRGPVFTGTLRTGTGTVRTGTVRTGTVRFRIASPILKNQSPRSLVAGGIVHGTRRKQKSKITRSKRGVTHRRVRTRSNHSAKWESCVLKVKAQGRAVNPWAICTASVGW